MLFIYCLPETHTVTLNYILLIAFSGNGLCGLKLAKHGRENLSRCLPYTYRHIHIAACFVVIETFILWKITFCDIAKDPDHDQGIKLVPFSPITAPSVRQIQGVNRLLSLYLVNFLDLQPFPRNILTF